MTRAKRTIDARRSRRVRTRLTRVFALAVVGPVMAGSIAYAAGVGPVRRRVDGFLKGTVRLLDEAKSSRGDFHLSPNPVGRGVLVMPIDDRGPRPVSENAGKDSGRKKEEKSSPKAHDPKEKSAPTTAPKPKDQKSDSGSREPNKETSTSPDDAKVSESGMGSGEVGEASGQGGSESDDDSDEGSGDSGGGSSGSDSGSGDSDEDDSGSSGESGSGSEED